MKSRSEEVIKNCFQGSNVIECDENNNCRIPKEKLQKSAHKIYMNIVAFVDLVIGYSFAVFSPNSDAKIKWILTKVFVFTFSLPILEYYFSLFYARRKYKEDIITLVDKLEEVDTIVTTKEIDGMF